MENIIVLPGTQWQIPLIKKINQMGYRSICLNITPDSAAFNDAAESKIVDILDYEACKKVIKDYTPVAIMSDECDIAVVPVVKLSKYFGTRSISLDEANLYTNKYLMREFSRAKGFATPAFYKVNNIEDAIKIFRQKREKMIIKPLDSNSSRGVYSVESPEDIEKYFNDTISFSKIEKAVLLEEYIEGTEFTVDGIKTENGHKSLAISRKKHYEYNENIARELYFSHYDTEYDYDKLREINDDFVNKSKLTYGLTHGEYKYKDGQYYLIEIGARGGGNMISSDIVPFVSGVDNYNYLINKTLGKYVDENIEIEERFKSRCAVLKFFDIKESGILKSIKGKEYLDNCDKIIKWGFNYQTGDKVKKASDDSKRAGYYIALGENKKELDGIIKEVEKKVKFMF